MRVRLFVRYSLMVFFCAFTIAAMLGALLARHIDFAAELFWAVSAVFTFFFAYRFLNKFGALIIALHLLILSLWIWAVPIEPVVDFERFMRIARLLTENMPLDAAIADHCALYPHILGYPAILSLWFRLTGVSLLSAQIFNIFCSGIICFSLFFIMRRIAGCNAGLACVLLLSVNPNYIMAVSIPGADIVHAAFLMSAFSLWFFLTGKNHKTYDAAIWCVLGFLLAAGNAIRPLGIIALIAIWLATFIFVKSPMKPAYLIVMTAIYMLLTFYSYIGADLLLQRDTARNGGGWSLYTGMNTEYDGGWNAADFSKVTLLMKTMTPQELHKEMAAMSLDRIRENWNNIPSLLVRKFTKLWSQDKAFLYWSKTMQVKDNNSFKIDIAYRERQLSIICNSYWWFLLIMSALGMWVLGRNYRADNFFMLLIFFAGMIMAFIILEANARYHFPADIFLTVFASTGCLVNKQEALYDSYR